MELLDPTTALSRRFVLPDEAVVSSPDAPEEMLIQRRGCRVGDICLLISHDAFGELIPRAGICALPNVENWCLGLVNVRGNLVPVFDMHVLMDAGDPARSRWVLVLGQGADAVGITVDDLPEQLLLRTEDRLEGRGDAPEILLPHVKAAYRHEGAVWFDFDYQTLFEGLAKQVGVRVA